LRTFYRVADILPVVSPSRTILLPPDGEWVLEAFSAKIGATLTLAAARLLLFVTEPADGTVLMGVEVSTGVLAFDGSWTVLPDAVPFTPTVDTANAVSAMPKLVLRGSMNLTIQAVSPQAIGLTSIRYTLRRVS
jgi:hypothetical protein